MDKSSFSIPNTQIDHHHRDRWATLLQILMSERTWDPNRKEDISLWIREITHQLITQVTVPFLEFSISTQTQIAWPKFLQVSLRKMDLLEVLLTWCRPRARALTFIRTSPRSSPQMTLYLRESKWLRLLLHQHPIEYMTQLFNLTQITTIRWPKKPGSSKPSKNLTRKKEER